MLVAAVAAVAVLAVAAAPAAAAGSMRCFFSPELQGEYLMQTAVSPGGEVQYSSINVTETAIPAWGACYRGFGNFYVLTSSYEGNTCARCLHLKLLSRNVLEVFTSGEESFARCYTSEESALAACYRLQAAGSHRRSRMILFKTMEADGRDIVKEYCPVDGKFTFTYNLSDGSESKVECPGSASELDSCPTGSSLVLKFRQCTFQSHDLELECLGYWETEDKLQYLALRGAQRLGTQGSSLAGPQYRCALYGTNHSTGLIKLSLTKDSTCSLGVDGEADVEPHPPFEELVLTPAREKPWPRELLSDSCTFPDWMRGTWEHLIVDDDNLVYRDHSQYKTYTMKCVSGAPQAGRFLVYRRTQCGEEVYSCVRVAKRSTNVLELQLATRQSYSTPSADLCDDGSFAGAAWITQGRLEAVEPSPCPVSGTYSGNVPDNVGLCSRLSSDCSSAEAMDYRVTSCETGEVYDERSYRCLGQWQEDGRLYAYTQRTDVAGAFYECFVGAIVSGEEVFIKEAGDHCDRAIDPLHQGMRLHKAAGQGCGDGADTPEQPQEPASTAAPAPPSTSPPAPSSTSYFSRTFAATTAGTTGAPSTSVSPTPAPPSPSSSLPPASRTVRPRVSVIPPQQGAAPSSALPPASLLLLPLLLSAGPW